MWPSVIGFFTRHNIFEVHPSLCLYQKLSPTVWLFVDRRTFVLFPVLDYCQLSRGERCVQVLCVQTFSSLWDKAPGVQLLGCVVRVCLALEETATLFSRVTVTFYISISCVWKIQYLYILTSSWYCVTSFFKKDQEYPATFLFHPLSKKDKKISIIYRYVYVCGWIYISAKHSKINTC